jgi:hypothetical protein
MGRPTVSVVARKSTRASLDQDMRSTRQELQSDNPHPMCAARRRWRERGASGGDIEGTQIEHAWLSFYRYIDDRKVSHKLR